MQGYWNNTLMTLQVMRDGWFHTGDLGSMDDEGFVFIVDRKKDMIVSGGENIYSREVEAALVAHPDVAEAAVIGVPDPKWGESVKAFVVRRPGAHDRCRGADRPLPKPNRELQETAQRGVRLRDSPIAER